MIKLLIILCILLTAVIVLSVWGYTLLSKRFNYVFNNHEVLYLKMLEQVQEYMLLVLVIKCMIVK